MQDLGLAMGKHAVRTEDRRGILERRLDRTPLLPAHAKCVAQMGGDAGEDDAVRP